MPSKVNIHRSLFISILVFFIGCEDSKDKICDPDTGRGQVVSVVSMGTITAVYLQEQLDSWKIDIGVVPKFNVNVFSVVYETVDWNGEVRQASGAMYIPKDESEKGFPIYSGHHGTESRRENVASVVPLRGFDALFAASTGYVSLAPDYLGMGISIDVFHPYIHASVADGVIDFIRAARNYCCLNDIPLNGQLFLAGYSEGGYVTMATHKAMEENFSDEFKVTASAPMAGPHDIMNQANWILSSDSFAYPAYAGYIAKSYLSIYQWDKQYSDYFKEPYAGKIHNLFDGEKTIGQINDELVEKTSELYADNFLSGYFGDGEKELKNAYRENSVHDWYPKAPIKLFHGDKDDAVHYECSVIAYNKIKTNGGDISLVTIPGADHGGAVFESMAGAKAWFDSLKK